MRKLLVLAVPLALLGELGHQVLERIGHAVAHHLFHVLFLGGAVILFGIYAVLDVRRNGRPSFGGRIRGRTAPSAPDGGSPP